MKARRRLIYCCVALIIAAMIAVRVLTPIPYETIALVGGITLIGVVLLLNYWHLLRNYAAWRRINQKDWAGVIERTSRSITANPRDYTALQFRAYAYMMLKQYDLALADLNAEVAAEPEASTGYRLRAQILIERKMFAEAWEDLETARSIKRHNADIYWGRAVWYWAQERYPEALVEFITMVTRRHANASDYVTLSIAALRTGKLTDARYYIDTAINRQRDASTYNDRAYVLSLLGDQETALADVQRALALQPTFSHAHGTLGHIYYCMNRFEDAHTAFVHAEMHGPDRGYPMLGRAAALMQLGRTEEAQALWQRACALEPEECDPVAFRIKYGREDVLYQALEAFTASVPALDPV